MEPLHTPAETDWVAHMETVGRDITRRILEEPINPDPCHHFVIDNIFPEDVYAEIQARWPDLSHFISIAETGRSSGYNKQNRMVLEFTEDKKQQSLSRLPDIDRPFWSAVAAWFNSEYFVGSLAQKAAPFLRARFTEQELAKITAYTIPQLVVDKDEYSLGPHTDFAPGCVILLFYAPPDLSQKDKGTSLYLPKDRSFRCEGGPHYNFDLFNRIKTVEFIPNRLFGFFKTYSSWHGVEPMVCEGDKRRVLSWKLNLHLKNLQKT